MCSLNTHQSQKANHSSGDLVSGKSSALNNRSNKADEKPHHLLHLKTLGNREQSPALIILRFKIILEAKSGQEAILLLLQYLSA